jgi:hypothetical protein
LIEPRKNQSPIDSKRSSSFSSGGDGGCKSFPVEARDQGLAVSACDASREAGGSVVKLYRLSYFQFHQLIKTPQPNFESPIIDRGSLLTLVLPLFRQ